MTQKKKGTRKHAVIDRIMHNNINHYVYHKTPVYWIISRYKTKKLMFSILVDDLKMNARQKREQSEIIISGMQDLIDEKLKIKN